VARSAGPVILCIIAFLAIFVFGDIFFAIFAVPVGLGVVALGTVLIGSYLKVTISTKPAHEIRYVNDNKCKLNKIKTDIYIT
jgi:hypothetical protein